MKKSICKPCVLIVDDRLNWREQLSELLGDEFDVKIYASAEVAEMEIDDIDFDCAVLDVRFETDRGFDGDVSGLRLLRIIRQKQPGARVILLTGYPQDVPQNLVDLYEPDAFLQKGVSNVTRELKEVLRKIICKDECT